jgi:kinetochore protein NDC80
MQTLVNITGKDFRLIFHHLVELIDPWHPFDPKARFEDEFLPALKALRYPFASQIDTKWLAAPASMHSWPFLLGMLHWLVEMGKVRLPPYLRICIILLTYVLLQARLQYLESGHPTLQEPNDVPEEFEDPNHHQALAFDYYTEAYGFFLDGADAFEEQDQVLESRYGKSLYTNLWLNPLSHSSFFL